MKICFVETEPQEAALFGEKLAGHELQFVNTLDRVPEDMEAISIFIYSGIDVAFLDRHPALRLICSRSASVDHIDLAACRERNVTVCHTLRYGDSTVAEHTFALILAISRRIRESLHANQKKHFSYENLRGFELRGKTLGVVGTGRIGLHTIRLARAFEMRVLACDIQPQPEAAQQMGFTYASFEDILREAEIISLHVPLKPETHHLLNSETLALCQRRPIIINTARGGLIDTEALIEALDSGQIAAAGLDVLEEERSMKQEAMHLIGQQIINRLQSGISADDLREQGANRVSELQNLIRNQQLLARDNVIFTPHIAFNSVEAVQRINEATVESILAFAAGQPVNIVPAGS